MEDYRYYYELYHHGIKGQKWGIRRYQNDDGSYTPAGKIRYGGKDNYSGKTAGIRAFQALKDASDLSKENRSTYRQVRRDIRTNKAQSKYDLKTAKQNLRNAEGNDRKQARADLRDARKDYRSAKTMRRNWRENSKLNYRDTRDVIRKAMTDNPDKAKFERRLYVGAAVAGGVLAAADAVLYSQAASSRQSTVGRQAILALTSRR